MSAREAVRSLARGARRKLERSLDRRGVRGTLAHAVRWPAQRAALLISPSWREARREDRDFDARHGVDTARGFDPRWTATLSGGAWRHALGYNPIPVEPFRRALDAVAIEPGRTVFIDFGAGKGRAMLLASHYPFRRVLGVEMSSSLQGVAARNLALYRPPGRVCWDAEVALGDALSYPIPDDPAVFFFYDPFGSAVFEPLLARISRSLMVRPRAAWLVYRDPRCTALVEAAGFERLAAGDGRTAVYAWRNGRLS